MAVTPGCPPFKTRKILGARAIVTDSFSNRVFKDASNYNRTAGDDDPVPGMGNHVHREGYNALYGDGSVRWLGDPQGEILWWMYGMRLNLPYTGYANAHVPVDLRSSPGDWGLELADYYGLCAKLDENLGEILAALDAGGLRDDTIVLFTSDHGCHFRTRNSEYKRSCHESSIRIPMVCRGPGFDRRAVVRELVSLVDAPATLLDAAGLAVPADMHGRSALPLLDGAAADWPEEVFMQISEAEVGRAIRTDRWKYSVYAPHRKGGQDPDDGGDAIDEIRLQRGRLCLRPTARAGKGGLSETGHRQDDRPGCNRSPVAFLDVHTGLLMDSDLRCKCFPSSAGDSAATRKWIQ